MLPSLSGSDLRLRSYVIDINDISAVGEVRRLAQELAQSVSMNEIRVTRLSIIANELATNLARHAKAGQIILRAARQLGESFVEIISLDRGPGIKDLELSFTDGVSSGSTPGTGLGAIRRQSDLFDVHSNEKGTTLVCEVHADDASASRAKSSNFRVTAIVVPVEGELVAGDAWAICQTDHGCDVMVADGLGHGPLAHEAAKTAVLTFHEMDVQLSIDQKLTLLHAALRSTRGAAISMANLPQNPARDDLAFVGVGNVRGVICEQKRDRTLITHSGTVGLQFRSRPPSYTSWSGQGCFVMHSDGLQSRWNIQSHGSEVMRHPAIFAAILFRDYTRGTDDISVVACRYGEGRNYQ